MENLLNLSTIGMLTNLILFVVVLIVILLITRAFWCWFFKTSEIARLLEEISAKISVNHNFQVDVQNNEYKRRKEEWEQKYGNTKENNIE